LILFFKIKGEMKTLHDKHKLKLFITIEAALQKILTGILHTKQGERYTSM
jgi:hypothetical protein